MTLTPLRDLLNRMTVKEVITHSDRSVAWLAYREAEQLADEGMVDEIDALVRVSKSKRERGAAYFVLGCIGSNTGTARATSVLLARASVESDKYVLHQLLASLAKLSLTMDLSLEPVYSLLKDERWVVRHAALGALHGALSPDAEEHILELLAGTTDPYDRIYAHATLNRMGTPRAIPLISVALVSRKRDVKLSAEAAIQSIRSRHGIAP